ncbi:hypothetical protein BB560_002420 [Smittium megazygosporum]|uniref:RNA polymerase Rpb4/RPC9 core domain-containing protein n=1 Tax=Smittium megazygosporum TaxID=133381 RepID=A0A2T9ZEU6_9FUNG|nr:hypothetical protein BB560_002420 [Smittium megazygosporum]
MSFGQRHTEDEDASLLKLGPDFQNADCLLISEVKILLETQRNAKIKENKKISDIIQKTLPYTQKFSHFNNQYSAREARKVLSTVELSSFEIAQLGNLGCSEPAEAKSLIPSLIGKIDDESLDHVLKQLQSINKFQS